MIMMELTIINRGPGPPYLKLIFLLLVLLNFNSCSISAEPVKSFTMKSLCKNLVTQKHYRKIDGAVLYSQNEKNYDCVTTFQTHSILQRFMLRFDGLQLDCNDHLFIYDGAHAVGTYKFDLSCKNTKQNLGAMFTRTNYVTFRYVTDNWGTENNGFKLVITSVKDPKHACTEFRCKLREFCISTDLVCDGINHCADGSDESSNNLCQNNDSGTILGLEITWFVVVMISSLLVLLVIIVAISICVCRRNNWNNRNGNSIQQQQQQQQQNASSYTSTHQIFGSNGHMAMMKPSMMGGGSSTTTLATDGTTGLLLHNSGNWYHPVGLQGFHLPLLALLFNPFCQAG